MCIRDRVYNTLVRSTVTYGAEAWTLYEHPDTNRTEAEKMDNVRTTNKTILTELTWINTTRYVMEVDEIIRQQTV